MKKTIETAYSTNGNHTSVTHVSSTTRTNKFSSSTHSTFSKTTTDKNGLVIGQANSSKVNITSTVNSGIIGSALSLLFAILILVNFFQILSGTGEFRGLEWLLNVFQNAPSVPLGWLETWGQAKIEASTWGAFSFLANFLNKFNEFLNLCAFLSIGCVNILTFILYFAYEFLFMGI